MKKFYFLSPVLFFSFITCFSQPGHLDPGFGYGGKVNTNILDINKGNENINAVIVQPDGKIIVAGGTISPGFVFRYNTDGSLDNSFGDGGIRFVYGNKFTALALQPDGKIVAAGDGFSVVRFNSNGSFDNSFGTGGKASITMGPYYSSLYSIAIQVDGKIVLVGSAYNGARDDCAIARLTTDGTPDNSFDGDGKLVNTYGYIDGRFRDVAIQSDGKIVLAGYFYNGTDVFGVNRLNSDGSPDNSFDGDGMLTTTFGAYSVAYSIVVQADGKIVAAGYSEGNVVIARYNTNGTLDNSFDGDGKCVTVTESPGNYPASMVLQNDGKILVSAQISGHFGLVRYAINGSPDNSFDSDGIVTTELSSSGDQPVSVALRYDGQIVLGGFSQNSSTDFSLACYTSNGSLDNSFDGDGKLTGYFGTSYDIGRDLAIQNDGKIVVAGYTGTVELGSNNDFALVRYNVNGTLDYSFDGDGKVSLPISSSSDDRAYTVAVQSDGKIVAAGVSRYSTSTYDIAVVRFNANGTLDNSFDGDGIAIIVPSSANDIVTSIAIQSDGKIVLAGSVLLLRLTSNGSLDNSFDGDGIVTTSIGGTVAMSLQPDGKIIVAGAISGDFALARYNTNGTPDNSFDGDGLVTTDINASTDAITSIALQSDGKIVAGGISNTDFAVVRYNTNGSLDNSFDSDGKLTTVMGGQFTKTASIAIQSNGKIVMSGEARNAEDDFLLSRYNSDGSLDNSFDGDGKATLDLGPGSYEHLWAMKLYADRIYMVGEGMTAGAVDFIVAAVTADALLGPLPLQLLDFSGKRVNEDALVSWKTENESNMLEYTVERSVDGRTYTDVGTMSAANRTGTHNYNFTDRNITSLNSPVIYYRLRQKGIDGRFAHSRIVALPIDKNKNVVLFYPNPVINEANVAMTVNRQERLSVRIIDNKGAIVKQQQWNVSAGSTSLSVDVKNLAAGMYYLEIKGESLDYRKQFIK